MLSTITATVEIEPTIEQVASVFAYSDADSQAGILDAVAKTFRDWAPHEREMQIHYIVKKISEGSEAHKLLRAIVDGIEDSNA